MTTDFQSLTPQKAFRDYRYIIPDYQREYVWDEENVTQLLTDISEQASAQPRESYFIGMVLVAPSSDAADVHEVIDGQQRLTTLFLMMIAIRNRMKVASVDGVNAIDNLLQEVAFGPSGLPEKKQHLTPKYENGERVMKILVESAHDMAIVRARLKQEAISFSGSTKTLVSAYDTIEEYLNRTYPEISSLLRYWGFICTDLQFIQIVSPVSSALKIFETVNERGVGLSPLDLLKNLLFRSVAPREFAMLKKEWEKITKPLEEASVNPLRFLRYFIMANYDVKDYEDGVVREERIYDWFTRPNNKAQCKYDQEPMSFVRKVGRNVSWYVNFQKKVAPNGEHSPELAKIARMGGRGFSMHQVILLAAAPLPEHLFDHVLCQLETLLFTILYTETPSKETERLLPGWAAALREVASMQEGQAQDDRLDQVLSTTWGNYSRSKRGELQAMLTTYGNGTTKRKYRTQYLLARIAQEIDGACAGNGSMQSLDAYFAMHLEHILPDTPEDGFDVAWNSEPGNANRPYDTYKERLGNLTVLEATLNILASNGFYLAKHDKYAISNTYLTRSLVGLNTIGSNNAITRVNKHLKSFKEWNADAIEDRQAMLVALAQHIWQLRPYGEAVAF